MLWLYSKTFLVSNSVKNYNTYTEFMVIIVVATGMKHLKCRCLGGMTHYPQTQLSTIPQIQQLQMRVYRISVQQSQCSALVMQSEANQC